MDQESLKRKRSEDDDSNNNVTQTKVFVNQKMSDSCDPEKMKAVHEKTNNIMTLGAANLNAAPKCKTPQKLCDQYRLLGDGNIIVRDLSPDADNPNLKPTLATCCRRLRIIHDKCINCSFELCEDCGYSCIECQKFVCYTCVTTFGYYPELADNPKCEGCLMFRC